VEVLDQEDSNEFNANINRDRSEDDANIIGLVYGQDPEEEEEKKPKQSFNARTMDTNYQNSIAFQAKSTLVSQDEHETIIQNQLAAKSRLPPINEKSHYLASQRQVQEEILEDNDEELNDREEAYSARKQTQNRQDT